MSETSTATTDMETGAAAGAADAGTAGAADAGAGGGDGGAAGATDDGGAAAAGDAATGGGRRPGMLEELIENRTERKRLETERQRLAPVLSRLTPELERAILDGRVVVKPTPTTEDGRRTQLTQTAERLNLFKEENGQRVPDLEAAARVDAYVRDVAQATLSPVQQELALDKARKNIDIAVAHAETNGYDVETVRRHYENALRAPNGAALVADPGVAEELWYGAVGRAATAGKGKKDAPAGEKKDTTTGAIPSESTGRRGATTGIQLSPKLARVYSDAGLDPKKTESQPLQRDARGGILLE